MTQQGSALTLDQKQSIVNLKHYFDRSKDDAQERDLPSVIRVAHALNLAAVTVKRVMADYRKNPNFTPVSAHRGKPPTVIGDYCQAAVRSFVRKANLQGHHITVDLIHKHLTEEYGEQDYSVRSLSRALDRWGYTFGKGIRSANLKEKEYVISARRRYLRIKISNRDGVNTRRPEVYLDESYVNKNHSNDYIWYLEEDGPDVKKPTGKGERLIMINAITQNGWVENAKRVFRASKNTGDYHGQMNYDIFSKWFKEQLLPNIPAQSLIIMDNAPYHNTLSINSAPTANCKKEEIKDWLVAYGVPVAENSLKAELVELLNKLAPPPTYAIDQIAQEHGHQVLRTPQYHPELQPIEICWGIVKNTVANKCDFSMSGLREQLEAGFQKVTKSTCSQLVKKIRVIEDNFWKEDEILYGDPQG